MVNKCCVYVCDSDICLLALEVKKTTQSRRKTNQEDETAVESKDTPAAGLEDATLHDATVNLAEKDKDVADLLAAFHKVCICCTAAQHVRTACNDSFSIATCTLFFTMDLVL